MVDIRKLYAQTGMFTYDPGFLSTAQIDAHVGHCNGGHIHGGAVALTGSTGATGDANPANNTASRAVAVAVSPA